jgi:hypothetical protein
MKRFSEIVPPIGRQFEETLLRERQLPKTMLSALVVGVFIVLAGPPQGAEARSLLSSNASEQMTTNAKSTDRHHWRHRHWRHRERSHHLDPGW